MKGRIVFVAILVRDDTPGWVEDAINETLRPATLDPDKSGIVDYAFSPSPMEPRLPSANTLPGWSVPYEIPDNYTEGMFLGALHKAAVK